MGNSIKSWWANQTHTKYEPAKEDYEVNENILQRYK